MRDDEATAFLLAGLWSDRRAAAAAVFLLAEILLVLLLPLFLGQDPNVTDRTAGFLGAAQPGAPAGYRRGRAGPLSRLLAGDGSPCWWDLPPPPWAGCWGSPLGLLAGYKGEMGILDHAGL